MYQVPKDKSVRRYELTVVSPSGYTTDETRKLVDTVVAVVEKTSAKILEKQDWGKKDFSYVIKQGGKRHSSGVYTHVVFECDSTKVAPIDRNLSLNHQILRHLLVLADTAPVETVASVEAPKEEKPEKSKKVSSK